jgi:glycosyltransferase involved in cell wall biosynthesis
MNRRKLKILLIDEGLNTGSPEASKIGGGQLSRWRLFSQKDYFIVTVLTSEPEIAALWKDSASIVFNAKMQCYRPLRSEISFKLRDIFRILKESVRTARILSYELLNLEYDVIFLNDNKSRLLYIMSSIMGKTKFFKVIRAIEIDTEWKASPCDTIIKIIYMIFFNKILCPSYAAERKLGLIGNLFRDKLQVAYPIVDSPKLLLRDSQPREKNNKLVFANIGYVRFDVKGQDIIVEAIEMLAKNRIDLPVEVRFYGDGPDLIKLQEMIRERDLKTYLKVLGYEKNHRIIYGGIHACIIASRTETASLVLLECLHRNIPVIVSDIDPLLEIKQLYYPNLSFRSGNSEDLAAVMLNIINSNLLTEIQKNISKKDKDRIAMHNQTRIIYDFFTGRSNNSMS